MDKTQLMKLAHDVPAVLSEGGRVVRKLAQDNLDLSSTNESLEHSLRIHKLAMRMEERKLEPGLTITEKVAMLERTDERRLSGIEAAVEMQAGGFKLANLRNDEEINSPNTNQKMPGELGSSAHYDALDQRIQNIG